MTIYIPIVCCCRCLCSLIGSPVQDWRFQSRDGFHAAWCSAPSPSRRHEREYQSTTAIRSLVTRCPPSDRLGVSSLVVAAAAPDGEGRRLPDAAVALSWRGVCGFVAISLFPRSTRMGQASLKPAEYTAGSLREGNHAQATQRAGGQPPAGTHRRRASAGARPSPGTSQQVKIVVPTFRVSATDTAGRFFVRERLISLLGQQVMSRIVAVGNNAQSAWTWSPNPGPTVTLCCSLPRHLATNAALASINPTIR